MPYGMTHEIPPCLPFQEGGEEIFPFIELNVSHIFCAGRKGVWGHRKVRRVKYEYRSTKFETNRNVKCSKFKTTNMRGRVLVI